MNEEKLRKQILAVIEYNQDFESCVVAKFMIRVATSFLLHEKYRLPNTIQNIVESVELGISSAKRKQEEIE